MLRLQDCTYRRLGERGLLLRRDTGDLLALNRVASDIVESMCDGADAAATADLLREQYGISETAATEAVSAALRALAAPAVASPRTAGPLSFSESGESRLLVSLHGRPALLVDVEAGELRLVGEQGLTERVLSMVLLAVSPKLVATRDEALFALHSSAVKEGDRAFAFFGPSEAGKTTTARALASNGAELLCEDLLICRVRPDGARVQSSAEPDLREWSREGAARLLRSPRDKIDGPTVAGHGPECSLAIAHRVADRQSREGAPRFDCRPLAGVEFARELFTQSFLGSMSPELWVTHLDQCLAIVAHTQGLWLSAPPGLEALHRAAAAYLTEVSSNGNAKVAS